MPFKVTIDDKDIEFEDKELFAFLLDKAKDKIDSEESLEAIDSYLQDLYSLFPENYCLNSSNLQIYKLYFLAGFYFSSFINKNQTQIIKTNVKV
jgi:hypothetical protein